MPSPDPDKRLDLPTCEDVHAARIRIAPWIHRTPVLTCQAIDDQAGAQLFFKCENFQKGGAFKARGAVNAVFSLDEAQAAQGVATHSSGNHGLSLARAARCRGIPCHVVVPRTAPQAKVAAIRGYGGQITFCEPNYVAREQAAAAVVEQTGAELVHPYNDPRVIAGQGTCALELVEQAATLDSLIVPIGGGGLISGTALACDALCPEAKIYGAEPAGADAAYRSLQAGHIVADGVPDTIADGLRAAPKPYSWHFLATRVSEVFRVTDEDIISAMRLIWARMKIIVEPSSAVPLAVILKNRSRFSGQRTGVIVTGGNVDLEHLPW